MIGRAPARRKDRARGTAPRVGLFGILCSGNLGNDGSLEAVMAYLSDQHPDAELSFMCTGPAQASARYGVPATVMQWYEAHMGLTRYVPRPLLVALGKGLDAFRTFAWVRRHDVVIVPGAGILEASLPQRPWAFPNALLWVCASARLAGTKVALVNVGADLVQKRATRWMYTRSARLAHYRSYRDVCSRNAMRDMGVDVSADGVYPDLAFALEAPTTNGTASGAVGVGVMRYFGSNDDRARADEINDAYRDTMKRFVRWLIERDRTVRLFVGDKEDEPVVAEIIEDLETHSGAARVVAEPMATLDDLMHQMATVDAVVATRYHNVLCALKVCKPTLSVGYADKHDVLMADMGLMEFCHSARSIDFDRLVEQFTELEARGAALATGMARQNRANRAELDKQFAALSVELFGSAGSTEPARASTGTGT